MKINQQARRDAKQLFRICLVDGLLDESRARRVVQQMVAAKPRGYLRTLTQFRRLVELDTARHTAKVMSAMTLPADLRVSVQTDLVHVYGPGLTISFAENPALIGGMRIRVGSDVYDESVQARLADLGQKLH